MSRVKSMRGVELDVSRFLLQNEHVVAVGNANMNARGDILGPGGVIVRKREEIAAEYHRSNPNAVKKVSVREIRPDVFQTPQQAVQQVTQQPKPAAEAPKSAPQSTPEEASKPAPAPAKKIADSDK